MIDDNKKHSELINDNNTSNTDSQRMIHDVPKRIALALWIVKVIMDLREESYFLICEEFKTISGFSNTF